MQKKPSGYGPLTRQLAANLRAVREERGLSLRQLGERMAEVGRPISLNTLSTIELGKRGVDLDDVAALAHALGVPPLELVFPIGRERFTEVLPGVEVGTWAAAKWFSGEGALPHRSRSDGKWVVSPESFEAFDRAGLRYYREQDRLLRLLLRDRSTARAQRNRAARTEDPGDAVRFAEYADEAAERVERYEDLLRAQRALMRDKGLDPGPLDPELEHIDDEDGGDDGEH